MQDDLWLLSLIFQKLFLPVSSTRETTQIIENRSNWPQKETDRKNKDNPDEISSFLRPSGFSVWWMIKPCFQLLMPISNLSFINQKVFANSNVPSILLRQMEKNHFLCFQQHCYKTLHEPYKNVLQLFHNCIFMCIQFFRALVAPRLNISIISPKQCMKGNNKSCQSRTSRNMTWYCPS